MYYIYLNVYIFVYIYTHTILLLILWNFHTLYFEHIHTPLLPQLLLGLCSTFPPPLPTLHPFKKFSHQEVQFVLLVYLCVWSHPQECGWPARKKMLPSHKSRQPSVASHLVLGACKSLPLHAGMLAALIWAGNSAAVSSRWWRFCHVQRHCYTPLLPDTGSSSPSTSSWDGPRALEVCACAINASICGWVLSTDTYLSTLISCESWAVTAHCRQNLL